MVESVRRTLRFGGCLRRPAAFDRCSYTGGGAIGGWMLRDPRPSHSRNFASTPLLNLSVKLQIPLHGSHFVQWPDIPAPALPSATPQAKMCLYPVLLPVRQG